MLQNTVVARFIDGRIVKGTTLNVDPSRPTFHVRTDGGAVEIRLVDLKALFFVKDPAGNAEHREAMAPTAGDNRLVGGQPVTVQFSDGEVVVGVTPRYPPVKPFFYVIPVDPESNNIRVLVNRRATVAIRAGAAARPAGAEPRSA